MKLVFKRPKNNILYEFDVEELVDCTALTPFEEHSVPFREGALYLQFVPVKKRLDNSG